MGILRAILCAALPGLCLLLAGCPPAPLPPPDGYTTRIYAGVAFPESLPSGERLILNGNHLLRFNASGTPLGQSVIPFEADSFTQNTSFGWKLDCADEAYLIHDSNYLSRIDAGGNLLWTEQFKSYIVVAEALPGGGVMSYWRGGGSSSDDRLQIHSAAGDELYGHTWNFENTPSIRVGDADHIYVSDGSQLLCLNGQGETIWAVGGSHRGYIEDVDETRVLLHGGGFACYGENGALLWTAAAAGGDWAQMLPAGAMLYSSRPTGQLVVRQLEGSGAEAMSVELAVNASMQRAVDYLGEAVAVSHYDEEGEKLSLFGYDGSLRWSYAVPVVPPAGSGSLYEEQRQSSGPRVGDDGLIYIQSQSVLYALDSSGELAASYPGTAFFQYTYHAGD